MGFFPDLPPDEPGDVAELPVWAGPPRDEVGVALASRLVVARTDAVVVAIVDVFVYSPGFSVTLIAHARGESGIDAIDALDFFAMAGGHRFGMARAIADEDILRFGIEYADGRKATDGDWLSGEPGDEPLTMFSTGGGGGDTTYRSVYWIHPLPPNGPVAFVIEWPKLGIGLTRTHLDGEVLSEAGARSERLWLDKGSG